MPRSCLTIVDLFAGPIYGICPGAEVPSLNLLPILYKRLRIQGSTLRSRPAQYQAELIARSVAGRGMNSTTGCELDACESIGSNERCCTKFLVVGERENCGPTSIRFVLLCQSFWVSRLMVSDPIFRRPVAFTRYPYGSGRSTPGRRFKRHTARWRRIKIRAYLGGTTPSY